MVKNGTKLSQYLTEMRQFETRMRHILFRDKYAQPTKSQPSWVT